MVSLACGRHATKPRWRVFHAAPSAFCLRAVETRGDTLAKHAVRALCLPGFSGDFGSAFSGRYSGGRRDVHHPLCPYSLPPPELPHQPWIPSGGCYILLFLRTIAWSGSLWHGCRRRCQRMCPGTRLSSTAGSTAPAIAGECSPSCKVQPPTGLKMLYRPLILRTLVLIALLSCNYSRSQTIPTLVVTPRHEHNFEILKSWMQSDRLFATKTALQSAMENAFRAAQQNDYSTYIRWVGEFENQFQQLSDADQQRLLNFALQNFVRPESSEMTGCENCCRAGCGLTECSIQCPGGKTPRCRCRFFWADCGCEPF